jgi:predicted DNA-binding transcriptional regulator YafY
MADLGLSQPAQAALAKLQASLSADGRAQADFASRHILIDARGWRDPGESVACLPVLLDALWRWRQVKFVYAGPLTEPGERVVDPLGLVAKGATWYLVGAVDREPRTWRVSRMRDAAVGEAPSKKIAKFDLGSYWERSITEFRAQLPRYEAEFLVQPAAMRWVKYRGWRLLEERPERGRVRIRVRFDAQEEAVQFALSLGPALRVVDPPALRREVLAQARAILS